ncbi:MAG: glycosyltransferase family 1 protein [Bacteroidetes bacterium]|nr:MAG: glycosyltransferase family 1 protein [Bacteroidota bacterium]REK07238.1 MAG: glycosyltransferase family 1 protein [Bacteroidota bacterium]REK31775.1 MAG: glycosyltransferase family 1 protein [Bacteroidota bacterium]REK48045.1 MAG: glycosyltransferase family 1 protein [Bacteroidota bacterium]
MRNGKVILVTNVPSPYRIPLFNLLHEKLRVAGYEFKVLFGSETYSRRRFNSELNLCRFDYEFINSGKFNLGNDEKTIFTYKGLYSTLIREKPDCVIINGFSIGTMLLWFYSAFHRVKKIIWTGSVKHKGRNDSFLRLIQRRFLVRGSDAFITYGSRAESYLQSLGASEDKIFRAINTVDTEFFSEETIALRNTIPAEKKKHLTYIGYLSARKDVITLLAAIKQLSQKRDDFLLEIIGDGEDKQNLQNFVSENRLESFVRFHGFRQKSELPAYLAKSTCFLFQTGFDIWGLVLNEAMASGLPCICSVNAGACEDLIREGENGFIMDYSNTEKLLEKIEFILDNPEKANAIGQAARRFIHENATLEKSADGFVRAISFV